MPVNHILGVSDNGPTRQLPLLVPAGARHGVRLTSPQFIFSGNGGVRMEQWEIKFEDYYAELRCSPDDPPEIVMAIYKALAKRYHPDGGLNPDASTMSRMNVAKDVLTNPNMREAYDRAYRAHRAARGHTSGPANDSHGNQEDPSAERPMQPGPEAPQNSPSGEDDARTEESHDADLGQRKPPTEAPEASSRGSHSANHGEFPRASNTPGRETREDPAIPAARFPVRVDRSLSIEELLRTSGFRVDESYKRLLLRYTPTQGRPTYELMSIELMPIRSYEGTPNDFLADLHDSHFRPIDVVELLSLASQHSDNLRRHTTIVALDSPWIIPREDVDFVDWEYGYRNTPLYALLAHRADSTRHVWVYKLRDLESFDKFSQGDNEKALIGVTPITQ